MVEDVYGLHSGQVSFDESSVAFEDMSRPENISARDCETADRRSDIAVAAETDHCIVQSRKNVIDVTTVNTDEIGNKIH